MSVPTLPVRVERFIKSCQNEIKSDVIDELVSATLHNNPYEHSINDVFKQHLDHLYHKHHHDDHRYNHQHYSDHHHHNLNHHLSDHYTQHKHQHFDENYEYLHFHPSNSHEVVHDLIHNDNHEYHDLNLNSAHHYHFVPQHESVYPKYLEQITLDNLNHNIQTIPTKEVYDDDDDEKHEVVEAREELMKILANHKVVGRQINQKSLQNNTRNNNSTDVPKRLRRKRSLLGFLNFSRNDGVAEKEEIIKLETLASTEEAHHHPIHIADQDKWIAGCLMQCIFRKTHAVDKFGYPTLDGIVDLWTNGTRDQQFFM